MSRSLTARMVAASLALGVLVLAIVLVLLLMVRAQEERTAHVRQAGDRVLAATELRAIVVDLQAGQRGYLLTSDQRFLDPYRAARERWSSQRAKLLADLGPGADLVAIRIDSLIEDYLEVTIRRFPADPVRVRFMVRSGLGKRRVDVLRRQLGGAIAAGRRDRLRALDELGRAERRATSTAIGGLLAVALLVSLFTFYLVREIVRPVRRVAAAARRMSGGDLQARVERTQSPSRELADMSDAFNQMAADLQDRTEELESRYTEVQQEVERAAMLQRQLLPDRPPPGSRVELAGACLPAAHVGGDYFDYLVDGEGRVTLLVADVAGHGIASALVMAMVRQVVRREVLAGAAPDEVLRVANGELFDDLATVELFVTAFCVRIDRAAGTIEYGNAGHNRPLLRAADGRTRELDADGIALGFMPEAEFEAGDAPFATGDALVLYTDGVVEAEDADGRPLGMETLRPLVETLDGATPEDGVARVIGAVRDHVGARPVQDDVTVVIARNP